MVKYDWAILNGKPIHINSVTEELRDKSTFLCIDEDCEKPAMAAHLKGKREKHFQHINYCHHDPESHLHLTGKMVLKSIIENCLSLKRPYILEYPIKRYCSRWEKVSGITCELGIGHEETNLLQFYDSVKMEKKSDSFRPDIELISSKGYDSLFIEIKVSHGVSDKKIESGKKIIEISFEKERDIKFFEKAKISINDPNVYFFNFEIQNRISDFCTHSNKGCRNYCEVFLIFDDGNYQYSHEILESFCYDLVSYFRNVKHFEINSNWLDFQERKQSDFKKELLLIEKATNKGYHIKSCSSCKYSAVHFTKEKVFCKFLKFHPQLNEANNCKYYRKTKTTFIIG